MKQKARRNFICKLRQCAALLLVTALCLPLGGISSAAVGDTAPDVVADSTVDIWKWTRVDSQADLPESVATRTVGGNTERYNYGVLLLYENKGSTYMVTASATKDNDDGGFEFLPITPALAVRPGEKTFRTKDNVSGMTMSYYSRDGDNGNAKKYLVFRPDASLLALTGDGIKWGGGSGQEDEITVMTHEVNKSGANVSSNQVKLFANLPGAKDHPLFIDEKNSRVYTESSSSWDMGQFTMYVGQKEQWSALTHDITIQSGVVENLNGYLYVMPGVTINIEQGGVLSCSGVLYNNGYIRNKGDIVVQPGATIEQFCLKGDGGCIACDGGDLVILSGGRVSVGEAASSRYGEFKNGFLLKNGATCTNFGTLVIGCNAYVESGATLDNRASGNVFVGFRLKRQDNGNFSAMTNVNTTSVYQATEEAETSISRYYLYTFLRVDLLYGGDDAMLYNNGTVYLGAWAQTATVAEGSKTRLAKGLSCKGSGALSIMRMEPWSIDNSNLKGTEYCPAAWKSMLKYR